MKFAFISDSHGEIEALEAVVNDARASLEWPREQLSDDQRKWLEQLPLTAMMGNFVIAHANFIDPEISSIHSPKKSPGSLHSPGLCNS